MIRMEYPNISGNFLCDGQIHKITPYHVFRVDDLEVYVMEYFDDTKGRQATTVLKRLSDGTLKKIPLLNYNSLFEMYKNNEIRLTEIPLDSFFTISEFLIGTSDPIENFSDCLAATRSVIVLYIDEFGDVFYKEGETFIRVDDAALIDIMENYDIEWRDKESSATLQQYRIEYAIAKTISYISKYELNVDGLFYQERTTPVKGVYHYTLGYQYRDENGDIRSF